MGFPRIPNEKSLKIFRTIIPSTFIIRIKRIKINIMPITEQTIPTRQYTPGIRVTYHKCEHSKSVEQNEDERKKERSSETILYF